MSERTKKSAQVDEVIRELYYDRQGRTLKDETHFVPPGTWQKIVSEGQQGIGWEIPKNAHRGRFVNVHTKEKYDYSC